MKILLFNPPGPDGRGYIREGRCTQETGVWATLWPPVSLASAAAVLEEDGHQVRVIDFPAIRLDVDTLMKIIRDERPDFAIWNTGTPTLPFDLNIARLIKKESPETATGVIGTHVTILPEEALRQPAVDIVIRGEPEKIIRNLCTHGASGWEAVKGISYRRRDGNGIHNNPPEDFLAPEAIPKPAWHALDCSPYRLPLKGRQFLIVSPTRGCPYQCSFCTAPIYYGKKLRERPIEHVMDEIEDNVARHGVREFFIWADTFTVNRNYVMRFCQAIMERDLRIAWTCNSRVDTVDEELLTMMKKAGLWMISFGLESGADNVLAHSEKKITVDQSKTAVTAASRCGIKVAGHFIFGLPGETEKTMEETLALALKLPLDIAQFYVAAPFPGTKLYDEALRNNWFKNRASQFYSQSDAALELPGLPAERVNAFRRYAYKKYYARPQAVWKIFSMMELEAMKLLFADVKRFLKWAVS